MRGDKKDQVPALREPPARARHRLVSLGIKRVLKGDAEDGLALWEHRAEAPAQPWVWLAQTRIPELMKSGSYPGRWLSLGGGVRWGQCEPVPREVCERDLEGEMQESLKGWSVGSEGGLGS